MTELSPPIQSADSHTFLLAVDYALQDPELAAKVDSAFGDDVLALAQEDVQGWVKGAIDIGLPTATNLAERNAAGEELPAPVFNEKEFVSTGGDTDSETGVTPAAKLLGEDDNTLNSSLSDTTGILLEPDVFPIELRPNEIKGVEAHVALVALCAAAKKDIAAEELWERMPLSTTSRKLHEATLSNSRIVAKAAATVLRLF